MSSRSCGSRVLAHSGRRTSTPAGPMLMATDLRFIFLKRIKACRLPGTSAGIMDAAWRADNCRRGRYIRAAALDTAPGLVRVAAPGCGGYNDADFGA
jgi:hypothetical protein